MNKIGKIIIIIVLIVFISVVIVNKNEIIYFARKQIIRMSEEAIDLNTGLINNGYFGIFSDGTNAKETTKGINEAIDYANKNNIEYIKLIEGTYLISGISEPNETSGIILQSNITFDLNKSEIKQEKNNSRSYINISIHNCENVKVCNGTILGDREEHDYDNSTTNAWGHNISVINSINVTIETLELEDAIGDGIYISETNSSKNKYNTKEVFINNCVIHDNRRQGISIISGTDIKIGNNIIYNIEGLAPQSGIDLESNGGYQTLRNIDIYSNKFYNFKSKNAIKINKFTINVNIINNEINGNIYGYDCQDVVSISENKIKEGTIRFEYKEGYAVNSLIIDNNNFINSKINVSDIKQLNINNNSFEDGEISITSSSCNIKNNIIKNQEILPINLKIREENSQNQYIANIINNNVNIVIDKENSYIVNNQ